MANKNVCLSMTEESINQLKKLETRTGKSKSRIVRDAIKDALEKETRKDGQ
jgi:predicted DNA-binding protein